MYLNLYYTIVMLQFNLNGSLQFFYVDSLIDAYIKGKHSKVRKTKIKTLLLIIAV